MGPRTPSPVTSQPRGLDVVAGPAPDAGSLGSPESCESVDPLYRDVSRLGELTLCHEWVADTNDCGSYRYLHYSAYDYKNIKILEGETETVLNGGMNCGCGCCPSAIRIRIRDPQGNEIICVHLTGRVTHDPMESAEIHAPEGNIVAYVKYNGRSNCFEMRDVWDTPMIRLKMSRCFLFSGTRQHMVYDGVSEDIIGSIEVEFPNIMALVNGTEKLTTTVPKEIPINKKISWVALLFILKLIFNGKEYSKIVRI